MLVSHDARRTLLGPEDANKLTDAAALALAASDNLPGLTELELDGYQKITQAGIRALLESKKRAGLTGLSLRAGSGGPAILEAFKPGTAPPDSNSIIGVMNGDGSPVAVSPEVDRAVRSGNGLY